MFRVARCLRRAAAAAAVGVGAGCGALLHPAALPRPVAHAWFDMGGGMTGKVKKDPKFAGDPSAEAEQLFAEAQNMKIQDTLSIMQRVVQLAPQWQHAWFVLGMVWMSQQQWWHAEQAITKGLRLKPPPPGSTKARTATQIEEEAHMRVGAHIHLGQALWEQSKYDEAYQVFKMATMQFVVQKIKRAERGKESASNAAKEVLEDFEAIDEPDDTSNPDMMRMPKGPQQRGGVKSEGGINTNAEWDQDQVRLMVDAHYWSAQCCNKLGYTQEAADHMKEVMVLAPDNPGYMVLYAKALLKIGDVRQARTSLMQANKLGNPEAYSLFDQVEKLFNNPKFKEYEARWLREQQEIKDAREQSAMQYVQSSRGTTQAGKGGKAGGRPPDGWAARE